MPPYIVFRSLLELSSDIISIEEIGKSAFGFLSTIALQNALCHVFGVFTPPSVDTLATSGLQKGMLTFLRPMKKKIGLEKRTFRILLRTHIQDKMTKCCQLGFVRNPNLH